MSKHIHLEWASMADYLSRLVLPKFKEPQVKESIMSNNGDYVDVKEETRAIERRNRLRKVAVGHYGDDKINLPNDVNCSEAIEILKRKDEEENAIVRIVEKIRCFPLDGAVALAKVLNNRYGWTNLVATAGFWGPKPPAMVGVSVSHNETVQVPWGTMRVPRIDGEIHTDVDFEDGMPIFVISGEIKRKHEKILSEIAAEVRELVLKDSIYKGQAVQIDFRDSDGVRRDFDTSLCPKFMDLNKKSRQDPIYTKSIQDAIDINLMNPICHTEKCRRENIPLKRGIVLGGPFGTGKTLLASQVADQCVKHGWTFLYLLNVLDLDLAINFARLYQPCVLFAEDIDRAVGSQRNEEIDRILNSLDGITSKNSEVMVVLTTNNLEVIHRAFLRPGRIDTVIEVLPPDADAIVRMVRLYGRNSQGDSIIVGDDAELKSAVKCLVGVNAAFIREVVERAKLAGIHKEGKLVISPEDLAMAAQTMLPHVKLLHPNHQAGDFDIEGEQVIDPAQMAFEILTQKFAESILNQFIDPKTISKIIVKQLKKKKRGDPSLN